MPATFGSTLRFIRQTLGLSQLALANKLGSTQRHVSFLETGRSGVTKDFLQRICTELPLSTGQRGALFEASGFRNPFPSRKLSDTEIANALDMIERRILNNWAFPAFALDRDWTILRANKSATAMFAAFGLTLDNTPKSLLTMVLSPQFRAAVSNWDQVCVGFYFRLLAAAEQDATVRTALDTAISKGLFDDVPRRMTDTKTDTLKPCAEMKLPNGTRLRMMPFVGRLATVQDARLEHIEIELMVPVDDTTDTNLRRMFGA